LFPTAHMAKRNTHNIITGTDPRLGFSFYYSPHFGQNIWRRKSSLTGQRTKRDPAFKGFRQSSSRLKEASPIAASLYKQVPAEVKEFSLYRVLTGEAIKMLKEGMSADLITETLQRAYIGPLLVRPEKNSGKETPDVPVRDREKGLRTFAAYPSRFPRVRKLNRTRRALLFQKVTAGQPATEYFSSRTSESLPQTGVLVSASPLNQPEPPMRRTKTTNGLIYLGRLPECKHLKMWLRPNNSSIPPLHVP
jgi:hypothetical protein